MIGRRWFVRAVVLALGAAALTISVAQAVSDEQPSKVLLDQVSQSVVMNYFANHPDQAPPPLDKRLAALRQQNTPQGRHVNSCADRANKDVFNCDDVGLPQDEESIGTCPTNDDLVLEGTNDYRGLLDPEGNTTGWDWSTDSGHSVRNEGLLPPVTLVKVPPSHDVPSGGDPVDFIPRGCDSVYAASLAYNPSNPFGDANGIGVYKSTPAILSTCSAFTEEGLSNPACWPVRRLVAET